MRMRAYVQTNEKVYSVGIFVGDDPREVLTKVKPLCPPGACIGVIRCGTKMPTPRTLNGKQSQEARRRNHKFLVTSALGCRYAH